MTALCPTATWNTTVNIIAGSPSNRGTSPTLLNYPYNIYFDGYQNLYVADNTNHRIQLFSQGNEYSSVEQKKMSHALLV